MLALPACVFPDHGAEHALAQAPTQTIIARALMILRHLIFTFVTTLVNNLFYD